MARAGIPIEQRLWGNTRQEASGCLVFLASGTKSGHRQIHYNGRNRRAHTVAYELTFGPIPDGRQVNHKCDNPPCINPEHLYLGSQQENMADMSSRDRNVYGSRTGTAKLTELEALAIFRASGTHKEIASAYGVSRQTVGLIKNGINWARLTAGEAAA